MSSSKVVTVPRALGPCPVRANRPPTICAFFLGNSHRGRDLRIYSHSKLPVPTKRPGISTLITPGCDAPPASFLQHPTNGVTQRKEGLPQHREQQRSGRKNRMVRITISVARGSKQLLLRRQDDLVSSWHRVRSKFEGRYSIVGCLMARYYYSPPNGSPPAQARGRALARPPSHFPPSTNQKIPPLQLRPLKPLPAHLNFPEAFHDENPHVPAPRRI